MTALDRDRRPMFVLPDEPVAVRLMNTVWADRVGVHDSLSTPAELAAWLQAIGAVADPPPVTAGDLARARTLRDAVRRLAAVATADGRSAAASPTVDADAAVAAVNAAGAAQTPPRLDLGADGRLRRDRAPVGPPVAGALARVAAEAIELLSGDRLLRACGAPGCVLYFVVDHARREWCSTACGNRARAARHYRRHRPVEGRLG